MATISLKKSVCRVLTDLVESDHIISIDEMDIFEKAAQSYGLTEEIKAQSYSMTLADAAAFIAEQKPSTQDKIIKLMEECALRDGECCREEALLISSMETVCAGGGRIVSIPLNNRPILSTQILFVDSTYNPKKNELDKDFERLSRIVEIAGFELIYIPQVAHDYKAYKKADDLIRLLSIINPTLKEATLANKVMSLQNMDSRYFYIQVLNGRLQMGLNLQRPVWLIRIPNSVVDGQGYANFLCQDVEMGNISSQLECFVSSLNKRQKPYSVIVNRHSDRAKNFLYSGFHKALLDVMASGPLDVWEIKVYVRAGGNPVIDTSGPGKKFSVEIQRGRTSYPVMINGREAAFYLLLLCGSAGPDRGVDFEYDPKKSKMIQSQYVAAYHIMSNRESHFPDITLPSTFRPIKTKVMKALEECGVKGDLHLFKPTKRARSVYYIPINSAHVKIISCEGAIPLSDSAIFRTFCGLIR